MTLGLSGAEDSTGATMVSWGTLTNLVEEIFDIKMIKIASRIRFVTKISSKFAQFFFVSGLPERPRDGPDGSDGFPDVARAYRSVSNPAGLRRGHSKPVYHLQNVAIRLSRIVSGSNFRRRYVYRRCDLDVHVGKEKKVSH